MIEHKRPNPEKIPGFYEPNLKNYKFYIGNKKTGTTTINYSKSDSDYMYFPNAIYPEHLVELIRLFKESNTYENVSIHGLKDVDCGIGSKRTTMWSPKLAQYFDKYYTHLIPLYKKVNKFSRTDIWQDINFEEDKPQYWKFEGFSPMFRFMSYLDGGEHYTHYDAAYMYPPNKSNIIYRTLCSVVIYLTTNNTGATRFINDFQDDIIQSERINNDFDFKVDEHDIIKRFYPQKGSMLVFDHRIPHDVETFISPKEDNGYDKERMIIRTDLIYSYCNEK